MGYATRFVQDVSAGVVDGIRTLGAWLSGWPEPRS